MNNKYLLDFEKILECDYKHAEVLKNYLKWLEGGALKYKPTEFKQALKRAIKLLKPEISVYTLKRGDKFKMNPEDQTECEFLGIFGDRWCFTGRGGDDFYLLMQRKTVFSC